MGQGFEGNRFCGQAGGGGGAAVTAVAFGAGLGGCHRGFGAGELVLVAVTLGALVTVTLGALGAVTLGAGTSPAVVGSAGLAAVAVVIVTGAIAGPAAVPLPAPRARAHTNASDATAIPATNTAAYPGNGDLRAREAGPGAPDLRRCPGVAFATG